LEFHNGGVRHDALELSSRPEYSGMRDSAKGPIALDHEASAH
jgi:hypothetical protein